MKIKLFILTSLSFSLSAIIVDQDAFAKKLQSYLEICQWNHEVADLDVVKSYLDAGLDINYTFENGDTLLHLAAESGNREILKYLIDERQLDVNAKNFNDQTPLHQAIRGASFEPSRKKLTDNSILKIEFLVSRRANIFATNHTQETPIDMAKSLDSKFQVFRAFKPLVDILQKRSDQIDKSKLEADKAELELIEYIPKELAQIIGNYIKE